MFKNSIELFDIFGFKIKLDPSWFLIAALIVWSLSSAYFPQALPGLGGSAYISMAVIAMLGLFASLILHELSHSLVARHFNLKVGGITLFIFGGIAELEQEPRDARSEFWIAIAGPAASFVLAGLFYVLAAAFDFGNAPSPLQVVLAYLSLINLILAIFNLVPAFPMDGGRIFRAALWHFRGDLLSSTRIASQAGTFFGIFLITMGALSIFTGAGGGGLWQILIGFFVLGASRSSYEQLLMRTTMGDLTVATVMSGAPVTASINSSLDSVVTDILLTHNVSFVPVLDGDRLAGYIDQASIQQIERDQWPTTTVREIVIPTDDSNTVPPNTHMEKLFQTMAKLGKRKFLVAEHGKLLGVVALADMMRFLSLHQGLDKKRSG